jgi:type III secretion system chaperone SycN
MNAVIADFGHAAGVEGLALNASGASAIRFSNGAALRFEYVNEELVVSMTFSISRSTSAIRRLLSIANPRALRGMRYRAGILPKSGAAVVAVRLPERDVTLPVVNSIFAALWRFAEEIGGVA